MILYHGSNVEICEIDLSKTLKGKDFGRGFYLSDNELQAFEIAKLRALSFGGEPVVSRFSFDESILKSETLNVLRFESYTNEWADFVLANRTNYSENPIHSYDIVYGPIANDMVGRQIRRLLDGIINKQDFLVSLKYMKGITFQYYFGTVKATGCLRKIK